MNQRFFPIDWAPLNNPPTLGAPEPSTRFFTIAWRPMLCTVCYPEQIPQEEPIQPKTAFPTD